MGIPERERGDFAPFRTEKLRRRPDEITRLTDEAQKRQRLPAIVVNDVGISRQMENKRRVGGLVVKIGVVLLLIGAIPKTKVDQALSDGVAQGSRRVGLVVGGGKRCVVPQLRHESIEAGQRYAGTR